MALMEGCKHELEITVPLEDVQSETEKVVNGLRQKVRLPGFRTGKAPASLVRSRFQSEIRQEVLEHVLPKAFRQRVDQEKLNVVSTPDVTDVHFHEGEPLRFKAEFEVAPEIELGAYKGLEVPYTEPVVTDEDVDERLKNIREQKADYVNEDPRPLADGDFAVIQLDSLSGLEAGNEVHQSETQLEIGSGDTLPAFSENLRGMAPGDEKEFGVAYPDDYGTEKLSGKTVRFRAHVTGVRRKELPELNNEFAQDLGDFQTMEEVRQAIRQTITAERTYRAQQEAKAKLVEQLIDTHQFPVPETFLDNQIQSQVEQQLRNLTNQGVDPSKLKLDWAKIKESQREKATRDVRGSLLLEKVADTENIQVTQEEIDQELQRFAKQERQPVAALRQKFEKDGSLRRMAAHIRTDKTLQFLFDQAQKVAPAAA